MKRKGTGGGNDANLEKKNPTVKTQREGEEQRARNATNSGERGRHDGKRTSQSHSVRAVGSQKGTSSSEGIKKEDR